MGRATRISFGRDPVLVLGATGMLGRSWCNFLRARKIGFVAPARPQFDMASFSAIDAALEGQFAHVINCAAWSDVDGAEMSEQSASQVNGHAVAHLAARCQELGVTLVHYSSDYVFSGQVATPYTTDHPRDPLNAYGRGKALGEVQLQDCGGRYLLIRTSWMYAPWGKNMVRTIMRVAAERDTLRFVNDQRGRPTSAEHLVEATIRLLEAGATGTYHVTDAGECTWFEFAREIVRLTDQSCDVQPCRSAELSRPAARPSYSVLDLSKTEVLIGPMPHWQANLAGLLKRLGGGTS